MTTLAPVETFEAPMDGFSLRDGWKRNRKGSTQMEVDCVVKLRDVAK